MKKLFFLLLLFVVTNTKAQVIYNVFDPMPSALTDFVTVYTYNDAGDTTNVAEAYGYINFYQYLPQYLRPGMHHPLLYPYVGLQLSSHIKADSLTGTLRYQNGGTGLTSIGSNGQIIRSTGSAFQWFTPTYLSASDTVSLSNRINAITAEPPGSVKQYAGSSAPSGYLLCDGSAVSRTTYSALFAIIGTTYGAGNGTTTFNIPDLRQRFVLTKGASGTGSALGETGGTIDHLHTVDPPNTTTGTPSATTANISLIGIGSAGSPTHTHDVNISQFNSGTANPPYITLNSIIKY